MHVHLFSFVLLLIILFPTGKARKFLVCSWLLSVCGEVSAFFFSTRPVVRTSAPTVCDIRLFFANTRSIGGRPLVGAWITITITITQAQYFTAAFRRSDSPPPKYNKLRPICLCLDATHLVRGSVGVGVVK